MHKKNHLIFLSANYSQYKRNKNLLPLWSTSILRDNFSKKIFWNNKRVNFNAENKFIYFEYETILNEVVKTAIFDNLVLLLGLLGVFALALIGILAFAFVGILAFAFIGILAFIGFFAFARITSIVGGLKKTK